MGKVAFKTQAELAAEAKQSWRESVKVSKFQATQALDDLGFLDQVEALMADPATPKKTVRAWKLAQEFRYMSPTVQEFKGKLGLTDAQLDQLFEHAETIEA